MIEQLLATLPVLAVMSDVELASATGERVLGDCTDALRLELDCPQQELTPAQRNTLRELSEVAESGAVDGARLRTVARASCVALGLESESEQTHTLEYRFAAPTFARESDL